MQIIATQITTLDEARYFAAMGADWIGFDGERLTADEIKTICDWVVGPQVFVEYTKPTEEVLFELINKIPQAGICIPMSSSVPHWFSGQVICRSEQTHGVASPPRDDQIILSRNPLAKGSALRPDQFWFEIDVDADLNQLPGPGKTGGIAVRVVKRGEEIDFEPYDRIFDTLSEYRNAD